MRNFTVLFDNPWLLLLLLAGMAVVLFIYFKVPAKYRRTRNRVVSVVLSSLVVTLTVFILAGMSFAYQVPNDNQEMIILVDLSYSTNQSQATQDQFIRAVLDNNTAGFNIGIITFGKYCPIGEYEPVLAAPISSDMDAVWFNYQLSLTANRPNDIAADIEEALFFAKSEFRNTQGARILLVSDGIETDGDAIALMTSFAAAGIRIDTAFFSADSWDEFQLVGIELPDDIIRPNETTHVDVVVQSNIAGAAIIHLYNHGEEIGRSYVNITAGTHNHRIQDIVFETNGSQILRANIRPNTAGASIALDTIPYNNVFYSYFFLSSFDRILVLYRAANEAGEDTRIFRELDYAFEEVQTRHISEAPATMRELRSFDKVILANVGHQDIQHYANGFDALLHRYVNVYGGGMLLLAGSREEFSTYLGHHAVPNALNRHEMPNTVLQEMLPVRAVDFTPPIAVMFVVDVSGSMEEDDVGGGPGVTRLDFAKEAMRRSLDAFNTRDYVGIVSFDHDARLELPLTPVSRRPLIEGHIRSLYTRGGTVYSEGLRIAGIHLQNTHVERRHIIFITDGMPSDRGEYQQYISRFRNEFGITLSAMGIGGVGAIVTEMAYLGGGETYLVSSGQGFDERFLTTLLSDIYGMRRQLRETYQENFTPTIGDVSSEFRGFNMIGWSYRRPVTNEMYMPIGLSQFYGTVPRVSTPAAPVYIALSGPFSNPVYSRWRFGNGRVGVFSANILEDDSLFDNEMFLRFFTNAIEALAPSEDISQTDIEVRVRYQNFSRFLTVLTHLENSYNDTFNITYRNLLSSNEYPPLVFNQTQNIGAHRLRLTKTGIYHIHIEQRDAYGNIRSSLSFNTAFSYSSIFDAFVCLDGAQEFLRGLSENSGGRVMQDLVDSYGTFLPAGAAQVFYGMDDYIDSAFDPRMLFIIIVITLFLLDIASRKFKWKWPWEISKDRRNKRQISAQSA